METAFTRLVGCRIPLQQAGMGSTAGPELAAAVTEAGAFGMVGLAGLPVEAVGATLDQVAARTTGAFGANFLMPFLDRDAVAVAAGKACLVEFFYDDPDPSLVALVHDHGALAGWQVGSVDEAVAARDAGCDLVVAQGRAAGGHVRGEIDLLPLLEQVLEVVDVPVLAAGGIGGPRAFAAVMAAGAAGARIGTRFVVADEADTHEDYAKALIAARPEETVLTTAFGAEWPDAPHRVLKQSVDAARDLDTDTVGFVEIPGGGRMPVPRLSVMPPGRGASGNVAAMAHYAGESVEFVRARQPAAEIVRELAEGAERLLSQWG